MKDVEYAFVPPVRQLFAKRARRGATDPLDGRLWGHGAIRLGHARSAAGFNDARQITVAVIDSGIDATHPDLKHIILDTRTSSAAPTRISSGTDRTLPASSRPPPNNGLGISGVSSARILALKVLPREGEEFDAPAYYRALRYVIGRAQVLNLSLGGERTRLKSTC